MRRYGQDPPNRSWGPHTTACCHDVAWRFSAPLSAAFEKFYLGIRHEANHSDAGFRGLHFELPSFHRAAIPVEHHASQDGVTTRKCANCPVRQAKVMFARSAFRAETRFSRYQEGGKGDSLQKTSVSRSKSDNQADSFHLGATTRCPPRCLPLAQSARIHDQRLKLSKFGSLEPDNSDTFVSSPLMIRHVLTEPIGPNACCQKGLRALTPLICSHVAPYGTFRLDMSWRSAIEQDAVAA
jgi:hypothetical protein